MNTNRPATTLRRLFLRRAVPYALFAVACVLSLAASSYLAWSAANAAEAQARAEFLTDTAQIQRQIHTGLNSYLEVIRTGAVLLSADNEISGAAFRRFVEGLELPERYPGMEGMGFAQCFRRRDLNRSLRILALDGNRVRVWPATAGPRACPIVFLEPARARTSRTIGFDLLADPALVETLERARDTAQPQVTPRLSALPAWDDGRAPNLVAMIPVYRQSPRERTVNQRRAAFVGVAFSALHSRRLIEHVVDLRVPSLGFELHERGGDVRDEPLGAITGGAGPVRYQTEATVDFAGREWLLAIRQPGDSAAIVPRAAAQTLAGGLLLALALFIVTRMQVRAWETAARHEAELRASTDALREREAQANAANRAKDEFLATLSHELRTPLNVVLGWVGMLRHHALAPDRAARALEIVERNVRQQAQMIDDLLDVSRIVTGKLRLELRPVDFSALVAAVSESLRPGADAKGVNLQLSTTVTSAFVMGDADRLRQTIWNLISNAVKFTPSGGSVTVEQKAQSDRVTLVVRDTGEGISPEFLPYVFERFRQADSSTTRTHSGVGLGLAIVRELVELHGGTVMAHSEGPGRGATFTIKLPAAPEAALSRGLATEPRTRASRLHGVRVLVVDDDPQTLEMLTEALQTAGADVTPANSARRALERLTESPVDVIVSDIAMPGEDGLWFMRRVRRLPGDVSATPAVALTALARSEDRASAMLAGFQMHVAKPVHPGDLQTIVGSLAAGPGSMDADAGVEPLNHA